MSTVKVNLVEPRSGTTLTLGASGDTVDIPAGATIDATGATITGWPSAGPVGEPNFQIYNSVGVHWSSSAYVKVAWNNIIWETDTGSCDVTTNRRFTVPTGKGGKYAIQTHVKAPSGGNGYMKILVSGVELNNPWLSWATDYGGSKIIYTINILDLDAADYLEWWCYSSGNGTAGGGMYASGWRFAE